jgi:nicotinamide mononucleotide transporter
MLETLRSFSIIEWVGLLTGIVYVVLSAQNKISCWYFGIVSCACIAYHDFFGGIKLYSDGVLQLFYVAIGIVGLYRWREVQLSFRSSWRTHIAAIILGVILSLVYGYIMNVYTDAFYPWVDAFTTIFSVIATLFLVNRQLSAWIYFVIIDLIMSYLYYVRGWELYALLYIIFTGVAVYAVWNWFRLFRFNLNKNETLN